MKNGTFINQRMMRDVCESLRSQPGRVGLSFLSVMVGIVVLTMLLSILLGLQNESREMVQRFGADVAALVPDSKLVEQRGYRGLDVLSSLITDAVSEEHCGTMIRLKESITEADDTSVWAGDLNIPALRNWKLKEGRFFDETDATHAGRVILMTETTARQSGIRLGSECTIGQNTFQVIGIIEDGSSMPVADRLKTTSSGNAMAVTLLTAADRLELRSDPGGASIFIQAKEHEPINDTIARCDRIFQDPALSGWNMEWVTSESLIRGIRELQRLISLTAGSVALLCLVLGGTTLMSLMLADVRQRIPEIGLRRSIGASRRDVAMLFVAESCFITCAAALVGVIAAGTMLALLSGRIALPLSMQSFTFVIPVIVSIVLGCAFSFWPARVAAGLSPAQALRNA